MLDKLEIVNKKIINNIMNTISNKQIYSSPQIERIKLDNEISLILVSGNGGDDPNDPTASFLPEYFNNDPFKNNMG